MTTTISNIKKEFIVEASQETAFNVFTKKMNIWWPKTHHVGSSPMTELMLEPGINGRWYTKHEDGDEVSIGHVLAWDPFGLLVLNWQIDGNFKCDPEITTEVEVKFIAEGPKTTRIKFEHKNLERLAGGTKVIDSMDEGWGMMLNLYKNIAENES
jgi:uncharacterized protein YndB with AHSA1/START domain